MTDDTKTDLQFNALTDAWLPLVQTNGTTLLASPVEVLCGEKDGVDLAYPRDDFGVYARLLLSALVQALFAVKTPADIEKQLAEPLSRDWVAKQIKPVLADFNLFGPTPFLQILPPAKQPKAKGAAPFVFPIEDLFQSSVPVNVISLPIALVAIFAEQTYAGGGGSGHIAGPGGEPGAFTLVDPGRVRQTAWANSLCEESVTRMYAPDGARPWSNITEEPKPRAAIGITRGLFFQPRGIWLEPAGTGQCSFSGTTGPLVTLSPYLSKSQLEKKKSGREDLWPHPCAPLAVNSQGIGPIRLKAAQPAWTGLAQLLRPISQNRKKKGAQPHPNAGPAPVLQQWLKLRRRSKQPRLLLLAFARKQALILRRFFEAYPLTDQLLANTDLIEQLRDITSDAQDVRFHLNKQLRAAHNDRSNGGLALGDVETAYWTVSEEPFIAWLSAVSNLNRDNEEHEAIAISARKIMHDTLRRTARDLFDKHVALSEFDPRKQATIAKARRNLTRNLWAKSKAEILHQIPSPKATI